MISIRKLTLACMVAPTLVIGSVRAAEPGFYLGASAGQTTVDTDASELGYVGESGVKLDDDDTSWKAFAGYNFSDWLGLEFSYVDFGSFSHDSGEASFREDLNGLNGFLVGYLPIGAVDLFAKAGAQNFHSEVDYGPQTHSDNEAEFAYGVGLAYNVGNWSVRAEAEGFGDNGIGDIYFLSAGLAYHFGGGGKPAPVAAPVAAAVAAPQQCPDGDSDGVCDDDDACPDTARGTSVDSIGCSCHYTLALEFALDSAELTAGDMAQLNGVARVLANPKADAIRGVIDGYTDSTGAEAYNLKLSERRADAVAGYLESRGVAVSGHFTTQGYGEANPVASNDTEEGRARNRRVEIRRTDCSGAGS